MSREGFSRIIRGLHEDSKEAERTSIVQDINKACAEGITCSGLFSPLKVKTALRKMVEKMESDEEFNRDEFFKDFSKLYTLVMAPDKRASGVFHPSQLLDACSRQITYSLCGEPYSDEGGSRISGDLQRTFDVGTWYHIYMQNILYSLGLLQQAEVPVINKERFLNGKADGMFKEEVFGEKVILEIKTMNSWNFQKAVFKPFKKHEFQASLYARELGAKKILFLYINKDTSEIKDFLVPINDEQLEMADKKMDTIIEHVKNDTLPKRSCTERYCDNAIACPFATTCFKS